MNRRVFFSRLFGGAAAIAATPLLATRLPETVVPFVGYSEPISTSTILYSTTTTWGDVLYWGNGTWRLSPRGEWEQVTTYGGDA